MVKLDGDPIEGVEVLLEYLYTLGPPDFNKVAGESYIRAEYAYTLGDKYGLRQLQTFGREKLYEAIKDDVKGWEKKNKTEKQQMIELIEKIWSWKQKDFISMRELCVQRLSMMSVSMLEDEGFIDLVYGNRKLGTAWMKHLLVGQRTKYI